MNKSLNRWTSWTVCAAALFCVAAPAAAQYKPRAVENPATGETYHIEVGADLWYPTADMSVSSEQLNIVGDNINLKNDLGLADQRLSALQLQLRPARSHKLFLNYTPIDYTQTATLNRDLVFNGIKYKVGLPVNSELNWKTYEMGYEYDFVVKNWGFVGFDIEAKYTDVQVSLASPVATEFAHARGPIPALGGVARVYLMPNVAITGQVTAFTIPDSVSNQYHAHYVDIDVYGTLNLTNNIGIKGGYRSRDVAYLIKTDTGSLTLKGIYFGAVLRY